LATVRPEEIATGRAYSSSSFSADFAISFARLLVCEALGQADCSAEGSDHHKRAATSLRQNNDSALANCEGAGLCKC
jgi:hypothetical protein